MTTYAIVLESQFDDDSSIHTFDSEELWTWLNRVEEFEDDETKIRLSLPGDTKESVWVTIGSPDNDKAQALANSELTVDVDLDDYPGDSLETQFARALVDLEDAIGGKNIYFGLWY